MQHPIREPEFDEALFRYATICSWDWLPASYYSITLCKNYWCWSFCPWYDKALSYPNEITLICHYFSRGRILPDWCRCMRRPTPDKFRAHPPEFHPVFLPATLPHPPVAFRHRCPCWPAYPRHCRPRIPRSRASSPSRSRQCPTRASWWPGLARKRWRGTRTEVKEFNCCTQTNEPCGQSYKDSTVVSFDWGSYYKHLSRHYGSRVENYNYKIIHNVSVALTGWRIAYGTTLESQFNIVYKIWIWTLQANSNSRI